jgi:hypothetical protein
MDAFLDDLPQPALDIKDTIHGDVSEFHLPTLSSPLLLLQDVGPGYKLSLSFGNESDVEEKHGQQVKSSQII